MRLADTSGWLLCANGFKVLKGRVSGHGCDNSALDVIWPSVQPVTHLPGRHTISKLAAAVLSLLEIAWCTTPVKGLVTAGALGER